MNAISKNVTGTADGFWNTVKIYYNHPNSINKQVLFSEHIFGLKLQLPLSHSDCQSLYNDLCVNLTEENETFHHTENLQYVKSELTDDDVNNVFVHLNGMYLLVRKLIPKLNSFNDYFYEFFFLDKEQTILHVFTKHVKREKLNENFHSEVPMEQNPLIILKLRQIKITYNGNNLEFCYCNLEEKGINWLKATFVTKFAKILLNSNQTKTLLDNTSKKSNKLCYSSKVDVVQYYKFYNEMKSKYAKFLIENWTESSDPKKYVYEDIGIATYLMLLWNGGCIPQNGVKKQKFVDMGCGNGLLVHILNSEGHLGVGLDIRKRKIWDTYPSTTVLKVETVNPTTNAIYSEFDWLIGNHSDELTGWIPIMARRSGSSCQYFVLPCCPYRLNGKKFQRKNSRLSSYQNFLSYVNDISLLCGFETFVDKLRIPSTKRVCLIGLNKPDLSEEKINFINEGVMNFIKQECQSYSTTNQENFSQSGKTSQPSCDSTLDFKVRESKEKVRNCTKLPPTLVNEILKEVMNLLLKEKCNYKVEKNNFICNWNRGGKLPVSKLAENINEELLKQLKGECKGLQTLLKNYYFFFEVNQGYVQFRSPDSMIYICFTYLNSGNKLKWKSRSCWFYNNHPDKCPLSDDMCSYSHTA